MSIYKKLLQVQTDLRAPKGQYNSFGKYNYRSCEDIVEAVKPLLASQGLVIAIADELTLIGERYYIKTTVTVIDSETSEKHEVSAYAREEESKKGMDGSQVTGASSSYARKYALNGMFAIDDTKDSDATNTHDKTNGQSAIQSASEGDTISEAQQKRLFAISKGDTKHAKEIMLKHGYTESKQIKKSDYNKICAEIEAGA